MNQRSKFTSSKNKLKTLKTSKPKKRKRRAMMSTIRYISLEESESDSDFESELEHGFQPRRKRAKKGILRNEASTNIYSTHIITSSSDDSLDFLSIKSVEALSCFHSSASPSPSEWNLLHRVKYERLKKEYEVEKKISGNVTLDVLVQSIDNKHHTPKVED